MLPPALNASGATAPAGAGASVGASAVAGAWLLAGGLALGGTGLAALLLALFPPLSPLRGGLLEPPRASSPLLPRCFRLEVAALPTVRAPRGPRARCVASRCGRAPPPEPGG